MMNNKEFAAAIAAVVVGIAGVTWGLAGMTTTTHTPCATVTSSPWIDTVGGHVLDEAEKAGKYVAGE